MAKFISWILWLGVCLNGSLSILIASPNESSKYSKDALVNSLRCLETIRGDATRISKTRNWVAENLVELREPGMSLAILKKSPPHYLVPFGCIDSGTLSIRYGDTHSVEQLMNLALDLLPYAAGKGDDSLASQILRIATVIQDPVLVNRAWDAEISTQSNLRAGYDDFLRVWRPNLWNQLLNRLFPDRHWRALDRNATRQAEVAWQSERARDYYTCILLICEAEGRVRAGKSYPSSWIQFVESGIRAPSVNTRPAALSAELAQLALMEKRYDTAIDQVILTWKLLGDWSPQMSGIYGVERDLALVLAKIPQAGKRMDEVKTRIAKRAEIAQKTLDGYDQMHYLPLLAEASQGLSEPWEAQKIWQRAAELCAGNGNPEARSIGLTRIWMSYARANTWPTKETEALLLKTEKQLPEAYSKVNF